MKRGDITFEEVERRVRAAGLLCRGGFHPNGDDQVPLLADGRAAATVILVGNAGGDFWSLFQAAPEAGDAAPDPMNRWTERVVGAMADELSVEVLYPFGGPPYHPFQRWAVRAEPVAPSPLGVLIHPRHGLWHAYRAALLIASRLALPPREDSQSPCESCVDKPCLNACPVSAFGPEGYDVAACAGHIATPQGASCLDDGCLARHACPIGKNALYPAGQAGFHMRAFLAARQKGDNP